METVRNLLFKIPLAESFIHALGQRTVRLVQFAGGFGYLSYQILRELFRPPYHFRLVVQEIMTIGIQSFMLVAVTAIATGSVMALQFGNGLAKFGGTLYVPKLVALAIAREMGPVFTSLLLAGRIGSGIAAEVASMKVTQQIDAIRALGTSPIKRIVIPKVMASLIAVPLLTLFADYIGILGAVLISLHEMKIPVEFFLSKVVETLRVYDLFTGLLKTVVFALFISITACWKGLNTEGGTQGVGNATTWVVVTSSIFIMISDFFLTKIFILTVYPRY
ncbi:ABC transporter permease [bacterium]|jgi:phospholipid/cholesterol/gamma-HCH transport system permease protein|nr:ABC transporter permease [bacterium]